MKFHVKVIRGNHNCIMLQNNSTASTPWVVKKFLENVRVNPNMDIKGIANNLITRVRLLRPKHILRNVRN